VGLSLVSAEGRGVTNHSALAIANISLPRRKPTHQLVNRPRLIPPQRIARHQLKVHGKHYNLLGEYRAKVRPVDIPFVTISLKGGIQEQ
jgi:hypothetical protein